MHSVEFKTPSGIVLFAQVMEPLATEPLVVLASASPIVGALLGENRISVRHTGGGRRGWDSNPRSACTDSGFQDRCDRPLCHPSAEGSRVRARSGCDGPGCAAP